MRRFSDFCPDLTPSVRSRHRRQRFSVMRRFSDFLGLHDKLVEKHIRSGRIVPPAPEKSVIGERAACLVCQGQG